jgi:hypothetical protein
MISTFCAITRPTKFPINCSILTTRAPYPVRQAGHNKWSKISRFKPALDAERSRMRTRHVRAIIAASKLGSSYLEAAVARAKVYVSRFCCRRCQLHTLLQLDSVPKETIQRAISSGESGTGYESVSNIFRGDCRSNLLDIIYCR